MYASWKGYIGNYEQCCYAIEFLKCLMYTGKHAIHNYLGSGDVCCIFYAKTQLIWGSEAFHWLNIRQKEYMWYFIFGLSFDIKLMLRDLTERLFRVSSNLIHSLTLDEIVLLFIILWLSFS